MTIQGSVLRIVPGLQAISLVAKNIPKVSIKSTKQIGIKPTKEIVGRGILTITGIALIKPTAAMIGKIS